MKIKNFLTGLIYLCFSGISLSQNTIHFIVRDKESKESLPGVNVILKNTTNGGSTDAEGKVTLKNIPEGSQVFIFSFIGFETMVFSAQFPEQNNSFAEILLIPGEDELEEIIVEGTRSNRSIENTPTRVEVLTEEIDEASTMDPSKVAHLLTHSTGIQVQQTSATSNTANVRIQGLDGRYTQILKDGFPLFGGFSGSLSIMQIPPLDLRQVEYIKGSASTLYGGGAISGLINLLSKEPDKEEILIHLNASHIGAFDVNAYTSKRTGKFGYTLLAQRNSHRYFDADKDGYSDLPQLTKYNLNPKVFFYFTEKTKMYIGATFTNEIREGGDIKLLNHEFSDSINFYKETNDVNRITTQVKFDHQVNENSKFAVRNSFNFFHRGLSLNSAPFSGEYRFAGNQLSSFSEIAYNFSKNKNTIVGGVNYYTDDFKETPLQSLALRNEERQTIGAFVQYTGDIGKMISLESGMRSDYVINDKLYLLPRFFTLFKWTPKLTTRIGGGMGYRNPTIFNQESELLGYKNVLPIDLTDVTAERSYGGSADIGFKTPVGKNCFININQMFFYTYLQDPLTLVDTSGNSGVFHYVNSNGFTKSMGTETFFKFGFYDFVLFVGYTFTNVTNTFNGTEQEFTLTPKHSIKGDLLYALPGKWRIGADYEFKSSQLLSNGFRTKAYWTYGVVVERTINKIVLFGNIENFTNVRQTNYESLLTYPFYTPQFTEVWAPLDGIVFNAGIKLRL